VSANEDRTTLTIREAAAEWLVRLNDERAGSIEQSEFIAWLQRSPEHVREYLRAEKAWLEMGAAARVDSMAVSELLREPATNVIALAPAPGSATPVAPIGRPRALSSRRMLLGGVAAGVVALVAGVTPWVASQLGADVYATGIGEQRRIVLADGSTVELNTHSRIRVRLTEAARELQLLDGEAFFDVAHDATRPFRVLSGAVVVRAIGTQFNVYRQADRTVVTVIEGRVAVTSDELNSAPEAVELGAGDAMQASGSAVLEAVPVDPAKATAWRARRLIFENATLAEAIAQFNRYNTQQLVIEDAALAAERIDGVFEADNPRALTNFLTRRGDVELVQRQGSLLLAPATRASE
jgi:transmembrane sensor